MRKAGERSLKRLFLVYDDKEFAEWVEDELSEYGRFVKSIQSLDFFFPQWNATGSVADVIIVPEGAIQSEESFLKLHQIVRSESPETIFLYLYYRGDDTFIQTLLDAGNICISYDELDPGLLEKRLRQHELRQLGEAPESTETVCTERPAGWDEDGPSKEQPERENGNPIATNVSDETTNHRVPFEKENLVQVPATDPAQEALRKPKRSLEEQKAKLQKIKQRIIIEEKIVTVHVPVHYNSMLISIVSLYPRAGATFVTSNFARMLGENKVPAAVLEPVLENKGSTYYELMYGDKNAPKNWESWAEQLSTTGYISHERNWDSGGVIWIVSPTEPVPNWSEELTMKLLLASKRYPVTLCDISSNYYDPQCKKILDMSDEIWIVADGDPLQLSLHFKTIDKFKLDYPEKKIRMIGNKWNNHIKQAEWKEAVLIPAFTIIPDLGPIVLKYLWNGQLAWDDAKLKNALAIPFKPMARSVMAKEMYHLLKKQYGVRAKLNGVFKKITSLEDEVRGT